MIRTKTVYALAAMAALATPGCALADPAVDAFARVCGATKVDFAAVTAAAAANGWKKSSDSGDAAMDGVAVTDRLSLAGKVGETPLALSAWSGTSRGVKVSACTMHIRKIDFATVLAGAKDWTGFAAQDAAADSAKFRFSDGPDGRKALASGELDAAVAGPGLEILTISTEGHGAILDLMMIKK